MDKHLTANAYGVFQHYVVDYNSDGKERYVSGTYQAIETGNYDTMLDLYKGKKNSSHRISRYENFVMFPVEFCIDDEVTYKNSKYYVKGVVQLSSLATFRISSSSGASLYN